MMRQTTRSRLAPRGETRGDMDWKDIQQLFANAKKNADQWVDFAASDSDDDDDDEEELAADRGNAQNGALEKLETLSKAQKKVMFEERAQPIAGETLYDATMDDADELWVRNNLRKYMDPQKEKEKGAKDRPSDATLNCPACFTVLCYDCQRHARYKNQWRAMFVLHTEEASDQVLAGEGGEEYVPVRCGYCKIEVGVKDHEGVYHFFNVFPSEPSS